MKNIKPKNRIMCPDCGRQKMFFESESKANNFIKWNKEDIENGDKLRAYYCPACCGWHISHQEYNKNMEGKTDKLIETYNNLKETNRYPYIDDIINEVYQIIVTSKLKDRKQINQLLRQAEYSHYSQFVKQEAKIKYYIENNL
jgi:hypothetical protein